MKTSPRPSIFLDNGLQRSFELNGYVTVPLLSKDEVEQLKVRYLESVQSTPEGFYSTSFSKDEKLKSTLDEAIQDSLKNKLDSVFQAHQNLGTCYLSKSPGQAGEMACHQDWTVVDESTYDSLSIWIPLQDVDTDNGALQVIPGSHRFSDIIRSPFFPNPLGELGDELKKDLVDVPLKAGEAIVFNHALIHASPPNTTEELRLAVTYGIIHKDAQLMFYAKNEDGQAEEYDVPTEFFKLYNTNIGSKPSIGSLKRSFAMEQTKLTLSEYRIARKKFQIEKSKKTPMIPIFKSKEHQEFFEKEGYLCLPLLNAEEVNELKDFYQSLGIKDEKDYGFIVSMDDLSPDQSRKVREKIWSTILPKFDQYLENYKPFVASYVSKESNPKGVVPAHQDWSFVDKEDEGFCSITCWTALVDTHLDNGCMGVIKGSHKLMQNHRPSPSPQTPVPLGEHMFSIFPYLTTLEMKAGEVLFFDNRTFHASPPNTTNEIRLAAGVGITQKDAQLVHYHLKPDGNKDTLQKFKIDEEFFLKYTNASLAKMYDNGETIEDYELLEEVPYTYDQFSSEELVELIKASGNDFNVPMCEKLSVLFGYDMSGKKKEEAPAEQPVAEEQAANTTPEKEPSFFEVYTPLNILREVKYRITGK